MIFKINYFKILYYYVYIVGIFNKFFIFLLYKRRNIFFQLFEFNVEFFLYGIYLDKVESVLFKINVKFQLKMIIFIFFFLNEEKFKGFFLENVQKEVSGEYCKLIIRNDFYFIIYIIYLR